MVVNYKKKYSLLYSFKALSFGLGLLSLFIVIPHISADKELYGIYSLCMSLSIYFSYADLGFTGAAQKFASEAYIRGDKREEQRIVGFIAVLLLLFMFVVALFIFIFSIRPDWIINNLCADRSRSVANQLMMTMACFFPVYAVNRVLDIIFSIRMEDYKYQACLALGNLVRIFSVFYFFSPGHYMIVGYFLFCQIVMLVCSLLGGIYVFSHYNYDIVFIKSLKFDREIFEKLKFMAIASLIATVSWILYYELDQIVIAKLWGAEIVAIYAIGVAITTYIRSYNSILYSPFTPRMNYFIGENNQNGLDSFTKNLMIYLFPISFFPIVVVAIFAYPFITNWAGMQYQDSVFIAQLLVFTFSLNFITNPAAIYLQAKEQNSKTIFYSLINVVVFWCGIFIWYKAWGISVFPIMKLVTVFIGFIYIYYNMNRISSFKMHEVIFQIVKCYSVPLAICIFLSAIFARIMVNTNLLVVIAFMGLTLGLSIGGALLQNKTVRLQLTSIIRNAKAFIR